MADTITASANLSIGVEFTETNTEGGQATTRTSTITLPNYRRNISESDIKNAFQTNNSLIYGYDENDSPRPVLPENIVTAATTNQTITVIDIGVED